MARYGVMVEKNRETGKTFPKELEPYVDSIQEIDHLKVDNET